VRYADGQLIATDDTVEIDSQYRGRVIACMDTNRCLPGAEGWAYLEKGIMVDTDFGGLVHYPTCRLTRLFSSRAARVCDVVLDTEPISCTSRRRRRRGGMFLQHSTRITGGVYRRL